VVVCVGLGDTVPELVVGVAGDLIESIRDLGQAAEGVVSIAGGSSRLIGLGDAPAQGVKAGLGEAQVRESAPLPAVKVVVGVAGGLSTESGATPPLASRLFSLDRREDGA
jgi:hypothetical protein